MLSTELGQKTKKKKKKKKPKQKQKQKQKALKCVSVISFMIKMTPKALVTSSSADESGF